MHAPIVQNTKDGSILTVHMPALSPAGLSPAPLSLSAFSPFGGVSPSCDANSIPFAYVQPRTILPLVGGEGGDDAGIDRRADQ